MATVEELRADFTATFGSMTAGIRTIRQALQGIGQSSEEASQKSNRAFKTLGSTLDNLQTELKKTGKQNEFKDLNTSIEKAQKELKETGQVSEQSMKQLQTAVQQSKTKLGTLGDDGKKNMQQFAPILEKVDKQLQQLGVKNGLDQLTEDQKKAELQTKKLSEVVDDQTKKLSEVVDDQTKKLEDENNRYKDLSAGILGAGSKSQQLREKSEHLTNVMKIQAETVDVLKRKYNDSVSAVGKNADETKRLESALNHASDSMKNTENDLKQTNATISAQSTLWGRMNTRLGDAKQRFQSLEDSGSTVARTFGIATAVIGGGLGLTVKKAADFEQAMSNAKSVMDPADVKKYSSALEQLAITAGSKTVYSATEAAEAIGELQKAGVSTSQIMHGALYGSLNLATAGELDLKDAAEIASTALNAFKKDNLSVAKAADILSGAANASATDVGELKFSLSMVSGVASLAGMSFKDTATALAVFAQHSMKGSDAGTSLKTMLLNMHPQTQAAANEFERLGLLTFDASQAMTLLRAHGIKPLSDDQDRLMSQITQLSVKMSGAKEGTKAQEKAFKDLTMQSGALHSAFYDQHGDLKNLDDIAQLLTTHMKGMTSEQLTNSFKTMFGGDAIRGAGYLFQEGAKGVDKMAASMDKIKAADVAKQKMDNFKGVLEQLRGSLETASITIGEKMLPALRALTSIVQKAVDWFNSLPEPVQHFIAIGAGLTAALLGVVAAMGFVAMGIGGAIKAIKAFIDLMIRFRVQAALGSKSAKTFGASAAVAGKEMDTAGGKMSGAGGKIKGLHGILGLAGGALMMFGGKWGMISGIVMNFLPEIMNVGKGILSFARVALTGGAAAEGLAGGLGGTATILEILGGPIGWIILGVTTLATAFYLAYKNIKPFHDWVDRTASSLKDGFVGAVNKVKDFFQPMIKTTIEWGKSVDKATQTALNGYVKLSDQAQRKLEELVITGKKVGKQDVANLVKPYKQMADQIIGHFERMDKQSENALAALRKANKKEYEQIKKDAQSGTEKKEKAVRAIEGQIENIYKDAANNHRSITADEQDKINKLQSKMNTYAVQSMTRSQKQQEIILGKLRDHASNLSADQAAAVVRNAKKQEEQTISHANSQYKGVVKSANSQYKSAKKWADQQYYALHNISKDQYDAVVGSARDQRDSTISAAKKQRDKVVDHAKSMQSNVVKQAKKQAHGHVDQVNWETGKVLSKWDEFAIGLSFVVNDISGFFNKMFSKIGLKSLKIPTWKPAGYAKGTKGTQKDEIALTGEEGFELAHSPGAGIYTVGARGPEMRYLPKGTSILPHGKSVDLLSALDIKGYASGVGDFFSGLWDKVKGGVSWASDMVFSAPKKLVNWVSDKVGLGDFQKSLSDWPTINGLSVQLPKNMFKGIIDKLKDFGSSADPPGSGVERWRTSVIRALAMNGLSTSGSMVNKVLRQMQTESGGNPKAVQHGYTDINTIKGDIAKGLMQTISATFNAYKFPGHGNIFNGFDNLLAALNYAKNRYGSSLSALGKGHGYANGGWNFMHTLAEISEGDKAEVILPVENKNRTLDLMAQVLSTYGVKGTSTVESSNDNSKYQLSVLELLQKIADSNGKDIFIDGQKITDYIAHQLSFNARRKKAF